MKYYIGALNNQTVHPLTFTRSMMSLCEILETIHALDMHTPIRKYFKHSMFKV